MFRKIWKTLSWKKKQTKVLEYKKNDDQKKKEGQEEFKLTQKHTKNYGFVSTSCYKQFGIVGK